MNSVAIVGRFASGKTTLANGLAIEHGYRRVSLATRLKEVAASAIGYGTAIEKDVVYEVISLSGSSRLVSGRRVLQELGQSVKQLDRGFWTRWLLSDIASGVYGPGPFVVDDCRFPYEASEFGQRGFRIIRLNVPDETRIERYVASYGVAPTPEEMSHPSEAETENIPEDFSVDGTLPPAEVLRLVTEYLQSD